MSDYTWAATLKSIYEKSLTAYRGGHCEVGAGLDGLDIAWLADIGLKPIHVFDHVEDFVKYGEPDWEAFLLVAAARRDHFLYEQRGAVCAEEIRPSDLPPKTEEFDGIPWLPRIIRKARCFLNGGLCHDIMFGCSGDRAFLKKFDIPAADFLRIVWASHGDAKKIAGYLRHGR